MPRNPPILHPGGSDAQGTRPPAEASAPDIMEIRLNVRSRDDIPSILTGIQDPCGDEGTGKRLSGPPDGMVPPGKSRRAGRPGMELRTIPVPGVVRRGPGYECPRLVDSVSLHAPELPAEVGRVVVERGHRVAAEKPGTASRGRRRIGHQQPWAPWPRPGAEPRKGGLRRRRGAGGSGREPPPPRPDAAGEGAPCAPRRRLTGASTGKPAHGRPRRCGARAGGHRRARFCTKVAERQGFEPWEPVKVQRFSRPPRSTTPAPLQKRHMMPLEHAEAGRNLVCFAKADLGNVPEHSCPEPCQRCTETSFEQPIVQKPILIMRIHPV